ncbi:MAG: (4Fe-4S)-binding protein [Gemmatimonadaceae bacterium]
MSDAAAREAAAPLPADEPNRAPAVTREYSTDRITIEWYAERCIHSGNCVRALPRVFDPRRRPRVDVDAASADELARAVLRCPTGALQFVRHDRGSQETPDVPATLTPIRNG